MERISSLALTVLLALAFALGLTFDSIVGWVQSYDTPSIVEACQDQADRSACATLASAEATASIARWTRLDTLFSFFTAVAAYFAYRAYRASERQATESETARLLGISQNAAHLKLEKMWFTSSFDLAQNSFYICPSLVIINVGKTNATDVLVEADITVTVTTDRKDCAIAGCKLIETFDVLVPENPAMIEDSATINARTAGLTPDALFDIRFIIKVHWSDFAGDSHWREFSVTRRVHPHLGQYSMCEITPTSRSAPTGALRGSRS